jgi:hypothetical protein
VIVRRTDRQAVESLAGGSANDGRAAIASTPQPWENPPDPRAARWVTMSREVARGAQAVAVPTAATWASGTRKGGDRLPSPVRRWV